MKKLLGLLTLVSSVAVFVSCSKRVENLTAPRPDDAATVTSQPVAAGQTVQRARAQGPAAGAPNSVAPKSTPGSSEPGPPPVASTAPITASLDDSSHPVSYSGTYQDLFIPNDPSIVKVSFTLRGGDGGYARVHDTDILSNEHVVKADGGSGAGVSAAFTTGPGPNQIPLGSIVRFVVGGSGTSGNSGGVAGLGLDYGGGGGGTAVLLRRPGDPTFSWLAVAGGGAGAYQGMLAYSSVDHEPGQGGRSGTSGGDGNGGIGPGHGGSGGDGGGSNPALGSFGGGGGGALTAGGGVDCVNLTPDHNTSEAGEGGPGLDVGGYGGDSDGCINFTWRNGGFGFGGGGAGSGAGGGGGGVSGGGVGGTTGRGGGGGSYVAPGAASSTISAGGSTASPANGSATYQFTLNAPPTVTCKDHTLHLDASGRATLDPSDVTNSASDPEGGPLQYSLSRTAFDCGDVGDNTVKLTVTDDVGQTVSCMATVTVVDDTPPVIADVSADPSVLWSPDHTLRRVTVTTSSSDNCASSTCRIVSVSSDEPLDALGDGNTQPDWEITGPGTVDLMAERSGTGRSRVYTITVECTDASGNKSRSSTKVLVPHDQRAVSK